ncbi:hypothetical protein CR513_04067, partial [Mucuna pruriens]
MLKIHIIIIVIWRKNVIQVVMNNGNNYDMTNIGEDCQSKQVIQRDIKLVGYIYNHSMTLNSMHKFTNKFELVRHIKLQDLPLPILRCKDCTSKKSILEECLLRMNSWTTGQLRIPKEKKTTNIVLISSFWKDVVYALKTMCPIVRVLKLVDNEKRLAMNYIYEAMDRVKEVIQKTFNGNED